MGSELDDVLDVAFNQLPPDWNKRNLDWSATAVHSSAVGPLPARSDVLYIIPGNTAARMRQPRIVLSQCKFQTIEGHAGCSYAAHGQVAEQPQKWPR